MTLALRTRLALSYTALFGLLLGGISLVSYRVLARQLDEDATATLIELSNGLHGYLRFDEGVPIVDTASADPDLAAFIEEAVKYYQVYDVASGQLLVQSDALAPYDVELSPAEVRDDAANPGVRDLRTDLGRLRLSTSLMAPGAGATYLLQVGLPLADVDDRLERIGRWLGLGVPAGLALAVLAGTWLARLALQPVSRAADAASAIDVRHLRQRIPVRGTGDELDQLATGFNETLARLELAVTEMRQFSAALAHELRTPLTALRGEIELALLEQPPGTVAERLAGQLESIDTLTRLIDQLLTLARAEAGEVVLARADVALAALCADVVAQLEPVAAAAGLRLRCVPGDEVHVTGDRGWLQRLLINLIDNAIKFSTPDGQVRVSVAREGASALVVVRDTGIGVAVDALPHVFERFYRADPARSPGVPGAGLGLSLVRWIAVQHGGTVAMESTAGAGTHVTVRLPLKQT